jgi:hypothetical protein
LANRLLKEGGIQMSGKCSIHRYSFFTANRGGILSLLFVIFIAVASYLFKGYGSIIDSLFVAILLIVFIFFHILWDKKIKSKLMNFDLSTESITFYQREGKSIEIDKSFIKKLEFFPNKGNIYDDDDYIENMMSSGLRVITGNNEKFLIFSKVSDFSHAKKVLEHWAGKKSSEFTGNRESDL